jgi:hypothetical protein
MNDDLSTDMAGLLSRLDPLREDELARVLEMGRARGGAQRIAATPWRRARPAGRRVVGIAAAVAVAACLAAVAVVVSLASSQAPAAYALSFSQKGGYVEVRVLNPFASVAEVRRELAKNQIHVRLRLLPVPAGSVGQIIELESSGRNGDGVRPLQEGHCANGPCTVGLKVARGFKGTGVVYIGRPTRGGETYASTPIGGAFAPGEPLHCSGLQGASVARVMPVLDRLGLKVIAWRFNGSSSWRQGADAPQDAPVEEVMPVRPGEVELWLAARTSGVSKPQAARSGVRTAPGIRKSAPKPLTVLRSRSMSDCKAP